MVSVSGAPFTSGGVVIANSVGELSAVYKTILAESRGGIVDWRLLSAAGYRKHFGELPPGVEAGGENLLLVVQTDSERFTLILARRSTGDYRVVGFNR